jgi:hypothetical protein
MMIRRTEDGLVRLIVSSESYWIAMELETNAICTQGHPVVAMQTAAGVWFAVCEPCGEAMLAGPDILDLLKVAEFRKAQPATATVAPEDTPIEAGE